MLPPIAAPGAPSSLGPLVIDGIPFEYKPPDAEPTPATVGARQDMMDGSARVWERRPSFSGIANKNERFTLSFPLSAMKGDDLWNAKVIRASGGLHRVSLWTLEPVVYTLKAGETRLYLPRFRQCAAHLWDGAVIEGGTINTETFRSYAWLNGTPLNVTYAEGPTLASPGAGAVVIGRQPDIAPPQKNYVAMRLGDTPANGDVFVLGTYFAMECDLEVTSIRLSGLREDHNYTFVEL